MLEMTALNLVGCLRFKRKGTTTFQTLDSWHAPRFSFHFPWARHGSVAL